MFPSWTIILTMHVLIIQRANAELNAEVKTSDGDSSPIPCTCGVFFDSQLINGDLRPGQENNVILSQEIEDGEKLPGGLKGYRLCTKKCVDLAFKYANHKDELLCTVTGLDFHKQKLHLFVKNYENAWYNTKLHSAREYSCKDGIPVRRFL